MSVLNLTALPAGDPIQVYRYRDGLYAVDLLTAAVVHFDFFTWLAANPSTLSGICESLHLAPRPVDVMLTLFAANGWVRADGGKYEVTESGREFLVRGSSWFMGPYYASLQERPIVKNYIAILQTGKPAHWGGFAGEKEWSKAMETEPFASQFTASMDCRGVFLGSVMAKKLSCASYRHLLDIAGGSGIYACAVAAHFPDLQATVYEKPPVDRIASAAIAQRGLSGRVGVKAGDMFSDALPHDCDMHLFSNVLHDWDEPKVRQLLDASFRSLLPGGMVIVHDMHLNAEKTGPLPVAEYSAILMHSTEGRCYSVSEMERYLGESGFVHPKFTLTAADRSIITALKPK